MKGMVTCKVCGRDFPLIWEEHYIVCDEEKTGLSEVISGTESKMYDAFDCPNCGCQHIAQERKRVWEPEGDFCECECEEEEGEEE